MHITAYICLAIATLCWGGNTVAGKLALGHVSPMTLTFLRWTIATALIAAVSIPQIKKDWPVVRKKLPLLLFYGMVGYTLFNAMLYSAVKYTTAINVAIEQAGIPMLIFLLNLIFFRTGVSAAQVAGFGMTLVGVALTASHGDIAALLTLGLNRGDALMLVAVAAYSIYTIFLRWKPPVDWRTLMAFPALAAALTSLPLLLWENAAGNVQMPDGKGWIITFYTAIFASLVAQILYIKGVEWIGANRAGLFINLVPVFGTLLSVLLLGEALQLFHIVSLVLTLGGIAIAEKGRPKLSASTAPASPMD
ncbi:DMT family transporter [Rhizobium yanglingense]